MTRKNHLREHGRGWSKAARARRDGKVILRKKIQEEQIAAATKLIENGMDPEIAYAQFGTLTGLVAAAQKRGIKV